MQQLLNFSPRHFLPLLSFLVSLASLDLFLLECDFGVLLGMLRVSITF